MERSVLLPEMLEARERRARRQQELLAMYPHTLVCFTMNIAGPVKNSSLIREGFALGKRWLKERLAAAGITPLYEEETAEATGNEACYVLPEPPLAVKRLTAELEDGSALGRLFDIDVLRPDGSKVDRTELGLEPRRCLICGGPARDCARSRTHSVAELQERTRQILTEAVGEAYSTEIARLACQALLYEVCTTPKPGLVDRDNSGSHEDMDIFTFMGSTCALYPYFKTCAQIGRETAAQDAPETFRRLRPAGRKAEADMFAATKGVNTHKGAIFSMGILCAALGRLPRERWRQAEAVLDECAAMTRGLVAADFAGLTKETAVTTGQRLYLEYGITGVRGQVEAGFPAVREVGLPVLREALDLGMDINDAGAVTLLWLITADTDTNLIARSSVETQQEIVGELKEILERYPVPDRQLLAQLDEHYFCLNLSPGGSADLLAVCYLLHFLESED